MKIALAQINCLIGDIEGNTKNLIAYIERAKREEAQLVVFPELALCGYPPHDLLAYDEFISKCEQAIEVLAKASLGIAVILGAPVRNKGTKGKNLLNAALLLSEGKVQAFAAKALLPDYDVFDEYRHFEPGVTFGCINCKGKKIALTICEDLWDVQEDKLYVRSPMEELLREKPDLMINIAASPFSENQQRTRKNVLHTACKTYQIPLIYVNQVGAHTDLIFDGGSMVLNSQGNLVMEMAYFEQDFRLIDSQLINMAPAVPFEHEYHPEGEASLGKLHKALILGIRDFFSKSGFSKAIMGLSGGIDSALVYALAIEALGKENVLGLLMPSPYSSDHSISDSLQLARNLGGHTETIPISGLIAAFETSLQPSFEGMRADTTEENIQARIRAILLMAYSNKKGYVLLNTSNKSESAVGYGTLYGDMAGSLAVIGDLYKTKVYALAHYLNREEDIIPENILTKAPSAELRPGQKDSDSLPPYEVLDHLLFQYIERQEGPETLIAQGFEPELVARVLSLVNRNEFKRYQSAPALRVSEKGFGSGRRMPLVGKYFAK